MNSLKRIISVLSLIIFSMSCKSKQTVIDKNDVYEVVYKSQIGGKKEYYLDSKEVLARALEIASLLASESGIVSFEDWEYGLIKSRSHYEMNEGIYFNFNSFDGETQLEMIELFKFFFDTSFVIFLFLSNPVF